MKRLIIALCLLSLASVPVLAGVRSLSYLPVAEAMTAQLAVPTSAWLARCSALPIDAFDGISIIKATVRSDRVSALLRKDARLGWLQCYRLGVYAGSPVYACMGPTAIRDRMAASPSCSHAIAWSAVASLPAAAKEVIAPWLTCCGAWTVAGSERAEVPCSWVLEGKATGTLSGYGPGVVGGNSPCEGYGE